MASTNNIKILENNPLTFCVNLLQRDDRLDCLWFNPVVEDKINSLRKKKGPHRKLFKLGSVADINGGKRLPKGTIIEENELNTIPYVRATDIKNLKINLNTSVKISKEIHRTIQNYQIRKNDLVITIVGTIGDIGMLEQDIEVCNFSENVARIRSKDNSVISEFLLHYLDSEYGKLQTGRFSVGSLQYKMSLNSCRNIEVYLPVNKNCLDIEMQRSILDSVYSILKKSNLKLEKSAKLIKEANSIVQHRIGLPTISGQANFVAYTKKLNDNLTERLDALYNNPLRRKLLNILKKYPTKFLGELIKPQKTVKIIPSDFYRLIGLEQIDEKTGRIIRPKEVTDLGSEKVLFRENSILISKLQPEKGKIAIVGREYDGCVGSSELIPITLNSREVSLEYLWAVMRSDYVLRQWEYEVTGSSRMRIGPTEINNTVIPVPSFKIQEQIVEEIKKRILMSDKAKQEADMLLKKAREEFLKLLTIRK